jgi:trehalose synthase
LTLAGPTVKGVTDDPEGAAVLEECVAQWEQLPDGVRARVHLASLPMADVKENALMVNALQRQAAVVTQKSLVEGFGLTASEAMWKARPVVASAIGGLVDQVIDGETGVLLDDPSDHTEFGAAVTALLRDLDRAAALGENARRHVNRHFLPDRHLSQYVDLLVPLLDGR